MTSNLRHVYAEKALAQIPRLLTIQDRNRFSPTYGSFKRTYWMDKTVDYIDGLPQYGVSSLALAYAYEMPGNIFYGQEKILEWALAGMRYWSKVQHKDGSYDEFYPNERGWTGPTGFLLYAMLRGYMALAEKGVFPESFKDEFFSSCMRSARFIIKYDEEGILANHFAMGVLPVAYAQHVIGAPELQEGYERKLADFLQYHHPNEGWSLEYDGADIGYLSATVSFLGKAHKLNKDARLKKVMEESVNFLAHFVYPNGFYAGSMGSRQTLHFYSHGCELLAPEMPLAARVADAMLESLAAGKIVPAEIQDDRYFLYRIPEHLESYIDFGDRSRQTPLPYEGNDFQKIYPESRFYVQKRGRTYLLGNAAKGGVVKLFDIPGKKLLLNDCGIIGTTTSGRVLTSQWVDQAYTFEHAEDGFTVSGALQTMPMSKIFTPSKRILFVVFMLAFGWHARLAYYIKGMIRKVLVFTRKPSDVRFAREVRLCDVSLTVRDTITCAGKTRFTSLQLSDEFFVRYVPQSVYFQSQEFDAHPHFLTKEQLQTLNRNKEIRLERTVDLTTGKESALRVLS